MPCGILRAVQQPFFVFGLAKASPARLILRLAEAKDERGCLLGMHGGPGALAVKAL